MYGKKRKEEEKINVAIKVQRRVGNLLAGLMFLPSGLLSSSRQLRLMSFASRLRDDDDVQRVPGPITMSAPSIHLPVFTWDANPPSRIAAHPYRMRLSCDFAQGVGAYFFFFLSKEIKKIEEILTCCQNWARISGPCDLVVVNQSKDSIGLQRSSQHGRRRVFFFHHKCVSVVSRY